MLRKKAFKKNVGKWKLKTICFVKKTEDLIEFNLVLTINLIEVVNLSAFQVKIIEILAFSFNKK